jgi:hypothetical protein
LSWRWNRHLLAWNVAIKCNLLNKFRITSRLKAKTAPFFLFLFSSQKVLRLYLLEDGETVRHFVKSERFPYPIAVPDAFFVKKSPPYVACGHLR